jgi:hypothetical protein
MVIFLDDVNFNFFMTFLNLILILVDSQWLKLKNPPPETVVHNELDGHQFYDPKKSKS